LLEIKEPETNPAKNKNDDLKSQVEADSETEVKPLTPETIPNNRAE
jgi:hypothetical protein